MIIAIYNLKGGVGKSNCTATLAHLNKTDETLLLLDADPQQATLIYADSLKGIERKQVTPSTASKIFAQQSERTIIVDCPPTLEIATPILERADLVIMPCGATPAGFRATMGMEPAVSRLRSAQVRVLITLYRSTSPEAREVRDEAKSLWPDRTFAARVPFSNDIVVSERQARTVTDHRPLSAATKAYRKLNSEIWEILGDK